MILDNLSLKAKESKNIIKKNWDNYIISYMIKLKLWKYCLIWNPKFDSRLLIKLKLVT